MTGTLNFSVSGEFITDFARQRFIETKSRKVGVDILCKCLNGFPEDLAMDVVRGRAKLIGINELKVVPDCASVEPYSWIKPCNIDAIADCKASAITESQQKELVKFMKSHNYVLTLGFNSTANYMQVRSMSTIMLGRLLNILPHLRCTKHK